MSGRAATSRLRGLMRPEDPTSAYLSKSDFKIARTCPTKLYYRKCGYPSLADQDAFAEMLAEGGFMVETIAKLLYPDRVEIGSQCGVEEAARRTLNALSPKHVMLAQATVLSRSKLARIDLLEKDGDQFELTEVKAKAYDSRENDADVKEGKPNLFWNRHGRSISSAWRQELEDITFQVMVLQELFPEARIKPFLMMPDKAKTASIENIHSCFVMNRAQQPGSDLHQVCVEFTGDIQNLRNNHFLTKVSVEPEVAALLPEVHEAANEQVAYLCPSLRKIANPLSVYCRCCEFRGGNVAIKDGFRECWQDLAAVTPHILDLYHVADAGGRDGALANSLIQRRKVSLSDIPEDRLTRGDGAVGEINKRQLIQIRHTRYQSEWISDQMYTVLNVMAYPLHFIDFETASPTVPYHSGMHPYEPVAFQWSCHTIRSPGAPVEHAEWINVVDVLPNFAFAEALMHRLDAAGTVLMWASHENTILGTLLQQMAERKYHNPELQHWLRRIVRVPGSKIGGLVDMNQVCLKHYFHPMMKGSTSIKNVCDSIWQTNPELRTEFPEYLRIRDGRIVSPYEALPAFEIGGRSIAVSDGTGAIRAYEAMMYGAGKHSAEVRDHWRQLLLQYCKLDTLAMVWIWCHWSAHDPKTKVGYR